MNAPVPPASPRAPRGLSAWRRALPWAALVALLVVAQSLLVALTLDYEATRGQEEADAVAAGVATDIRHAVAADLQALQAGLWDHPALPQWRQRAGELLGHRSHIVRLERRDTQMRIVQAADAPFHTPLFSRIPRDKMEQDAALACTTALRDGSPAYSRSYFVPLRSGFGYEVIDVCIPVLSAGELDGFMTATVSLPQLLEDAVRPDALAAYEISFVDADGTRLARAGRVRGSGVYVAERLIDVGQPIKLRLDSVTGSPRLIPNLAVALVLGLSLALGAVVLLLVLDVRRRAAAARALAEALAFRKAMEDSLVTGLRARDLEGRVTYVNPAFCHIVGFSAEELVGSAVPPYWPPEKIDQYRGRQAVRLGNIAREQPREGFETTFMRKNGERFDVLIFEAPLVDGSGVHTGWMSAVLDVSEQRRIEEISRQQQERLQATARLATVGEMASLLSHELNQPLAAIASYAAGSLNLMRDGRADADSAALLEQATLRIAEQAERAGRVIKSVHDFVRRREQAHEPVRCELLIDAVLPLVRLQARKSGTRVEVDVPPGLPRVVCDRTMVEQVLLNLTRNGIQAMEEAATPPAQRELVIRMRQTSPRWVTFSVVDRGPGVPADVAKRLFTPFFTTRREGMGLGLSVCRTVIEQHGGALDFVTVTAADGNAATEFRFTLPVEPAARRSGGAPAGSREPAPLRSPP